MITVLKKTNGHLELNLTREENGKYSLRFLDYGKYGKREYTAEFGELTDNDIVLMIELLNQVKEGYIDTTHIPLEEREANISLLDDPEEYAIDEFEELVKVVSK